MGFGLSCFVCFEVLVIYVGNIVGCIGEKVFVFIEVFVEVVVLKVLILFMYC